MSVESIKVCCRFRNEWNVDDSEFDVWELDPDKPTVKFGEKSWTYDYVLGPMTEQDEMYEKVAKQTISDFMNGYHGTIFAYGQSGSGKTFSMLGPEDVTDALAKDFKSVPEKITQLYGITPRAVIQIFETINCYVSQGSQCLLTCSYIELYNEQINCLLSRKENLKIRELPGVGMNVTEKETVVCKTPEEIFECVAIATKNRAVAGTNQNTRSSRSHTILLIELEYNGVDGVKRVSRLNLVDLAGSERISKTGAEGQRLKEAQKINQSLTTLGMCIMSLTTPGSKHVPFRNSKLTLLLKESLGGNSKTTLLCTTSRLKRHSDESVQTLYFASRAKAIKNICKSNVLLSPKELQYLADNLKKEIMILRAQLKKAGFHWSVITDPKILAFISNDMVDLEDEQGTTLNSSSSQDLRYKRPSLIGLSENEIIMKYLELRAKYDSLLENAGTKIYQLTNQHKMADSASEEVNKIRIESDKKMQEMLENKIKEYNLLSLQMEMEKMDIQAKLDELNENILEVSSAKQIVEEDLLSLKKDHTKLLEDFQLTQSYYATSQEKLEKKHKKIKILKEENRKIFLDKEQQCKSITELTEKINHDKAIYQELNQQVDDYRNKFSLNRIDNESLKNILQRKEESEGNLIKKNKELQEEIQKCLDLISDKDKTTCELTNKIQELNLKYEAHINSSTHNESAYFIQIDNLKNENDKLQKLIREKISVEDLLTENEKILEITKKNMENKIEELMSEISELNSQLLNASVQFNNEKTSLTLQLDTVTRDFKAKIFELEHKLQNTEEISKSFEEKLKGEKLKYDLAQSRCEQLDKKVKDLDSLNFGYTERELKFSQERLTFDKELRQRESWMESQQATIENYLTQIENLKKEVQENKDLLANTKEKLKEEFENEKRKMQSEISLMQRDIQIKDCKNLEEEHKIEELKAQIKVLQDLNNKQRTHIQQLELDNSRTKTESTILKKESVSIKEKTPLKKSIFGVLLKKSGGEDFLKQAREEYKIMTKKAEEEIFKDNLDMLKGLRENVISLSPKTVSSRGDMADLPELDFANEETFIQAEEKLLEKEVAYQARKEREKKEKNQGMINII